MLLRFKVKQKKQLHILEVDCIKSYIKLTCCSTRKLIWKVKSKNFNGVFQRFDSSIINLSIIMAKKIEVIAECEVLLGSFGLAFKLNESLEAPE